MTETITLVAQPCPTFCNHVDCSMPGLSVHRQLPELTQTHVHWVDDAIQPSHPLSSPFPPAPIPSQHQGLLKWVSFSYQVPKDWSFSFSIRLFNEYSGLISFRMDWLDLLAVQGTLKSLLHHSSKASTLQRSAFFTVQLSHPCMTTGKTIALTAAAKSLQSCPTLCDPRNGSLSGSSIPGILQARTLEWLPFPSPMHESEK